MAPRNRRGGRNRNESKTSSESVHQKSIKGETRNESPVIDGDDDRAKPKNKKRATPWSDRGVILRSFVTLSVMLSALFLYIALESSDPPDPMEIYLSNFVCRSPDGYCHPSLIAVPSRRTHVASNPIPPFSSVMTLPRTLQIWDLDALRDDHIKSNLLGARHEGTGNGLDSGAYLGVYLALRLKRQEPNDPLFDFLKALPSFEELKNHHPVLWDSTTRSDLLGGADSTLVALNVETFRAMIFSEYSAFCDRSSGFSAMVNRGEYLSMRINVMSRSFGTGPPGAKEASREEIDGYHEEGGMNLTLGCRAMSPVLDMWDHHSNPNVDWRYSDEQMAFVVTASERGVKKNDDVMVSYGKYTDTHLFAKFGFVNGDGSGWTEASVAAFHTLLDVGLNGQFSHLPHRHENYNNNYYNGNQITDLLRYLTFDDGYHQCIQPNQNSTSYQFKLLKLKHLLQISNTPKRWIYKATPRNTTSLPSSSSDIPITHHIPRFNPRIKIHANQVMSTCRLLSLTEWDYNGTASALLHKHLADNSVLTIPARNDALEYRSLKCLQRLTSLTLKGYPKVEDLETVQSFIFRSKRWNAVQVRLGEMQTLEALRSVAISGAKVLWKKKRKGEDDKAGFLVRAKACPWEWSSGLIASVTKDMSEATAK